jgi:hypothetical protein
MLRYAATIYLSAFLLFLVQPLIARYILPWFGGGSGVWTACLLFFQTALVAGYLYAHLTISLLAPRVQALVHLALLAGACAVLPIVPSEAWKPGAEDEPVWRIALLLGATIGLPYLALSATGPLLQAWFARSHPQRAGSTYRLYALSNVGSLLALLGYPFVVDVLLPRAQQAWGWSIGFGVFAALCGWCAIAAGVNKRGQVAPAEVESQPRMAARQKSSDSRSNEHGASVANRVLWVVLPMCASVLLLSATSQLSEEIAPMPFVWVLPLAIYLITFIIAFEWPRAYDRRVFGAAVMAAPWLYLAVLLDDRMGIRSQLALYLCVLFVCCMVCHGEAYRLRPPASHQRQMTAFYLALALGGALGGALVSIVAPLIFTFNLEIYLAIFGSIGLFLFILLRDPASPFHSKSNRAGWLGMLLIVTLAGFLLSQRVYELQEFTTRQTRSFYGSLRVKQFPGVPGQPPYMQLEHGRINHGAQVLDPSLRRAPTTYYIPESGAGLALRAHRPNAARRVGVIGLGAGALAGWARKGETYRFYEIDPDVARLARDPFTFLDDAQAAGANVDVVMGDGRLSLEREEPQHYDLMFLDAFSGDAVPTHLLTREAFQTYLKHLNSDGIIAVNISNRYLDLRGVVQRIAGEFGLEALLVETLEGQIQPSSASMWVVLTRNREFLNNPEVRERAAPIPAAVHAPLWTDDHASVLGTMK